MHVNKIFFVCLEGGGGRGGGGGIMNLVSNSLSLYPAANEHQHRASYAWEGVIN